ncbi:MAG: cation diffusion facilitator family transporter [Saprospiraceae bacterium]|nr:cation diffusion facilitator family transporter [Saprospiraceae bacterium]
MPESTPITVRVQQWVAGAAILLFAIKLVAYFLTHSVAILTDVLESTVNVVTGFTGLYSLRLAAKPRDREHPYGHGKVELLSASLEGVLILVAGLVIIFESVSNLFYTHAVLRLDFGILLVSITAAVNYALGAWCIRIGRQRHSIALESSGRHLQTDTWTTIGIVAGLILLRITGIAWMDSALGIIFALIIVVQGYQIIRRTVAGIVDEADLDLLQRLIVVLNAQKRDTWMDMHNLRIIKYGPVLHLDSHLTVPWYCNVVEANAEVQALHDLIDQNSPQSLEMFIHTDDCAPPHSCRICALLECPVRKSPFEGRLEWTLENLTSNKKHGLSTT